MIRNRVLGEVVQKRQQARKAVWREDGCNCWCEAGEIEGLSIISAGKGAFNKGLEGWGTAAAVWAKFLEPWRHLY